MGQTKHPFARFNQALSRERDGAASSSSKSPGQPGSTRAFAAGVETIDIAHSLSGHLLIAAPSMQDSRFAKSLIYVCAHSDEGAMGIVINRPAEQIFFSELLMQLNLINDKEAICLPPSIDAIQIVKGGPVETGRGFVLHSPDYRLESVTQTINQDFCLTSTLDVLRAIADGRGPTRAMLALGYAGWGPGQLEMEIVEHGWLCSSAEPGMVFSPNPHGNPHSKYEAALSMLGADFASLSMEGGHC